MYVDQYFIATSAGSTFSIGANPIDTLNECETAINGLLPSLNVATISRAYEMQIRGKSENNLKGN